MARPNYGFQKRQKELAKQQKKEAKAQRRKERSAETPPEDPQPNLSAPADPRMPE